VEQGLLDLDGGCISWIPVIVLSPRTTRASFLLPGIKLLENSRHPTKAQTMITKDNTSPECINSMLPNNNATHYFSEYVWLQGYNNKTI